MHISQLLKSFIPSQLIEIRRVLIAARAKKAIVEKSQPRTCPICSFNGHFLDHGDPIRKNALCPNCGSLERHRLFWLWLRSKKAGFFKEPVIHFAPEVTISERLRLMFEDYNTADLFDENADIKLNIESIQLPTQSVGTVICFHVLEHVDDRKALFEISRILKEGGYFIVCVPMVHSWKTTYENDKITDPQLRSLHFGRHDHIRVYGLDFKDRLSGAGFSIEEEVIAEGEAVIDYALLGGESFFVCYK